MTDPLRSLLGHGLLLPLAMAYLLAGAAGGSVLL
jgi:hypothetical protein